MCYLNASLTFPFPLGLALTHRHIQRRHGRLDHLGKLMANFIIWERDMQMKPDSWCSPRAEGGWRVRGPSSEASTRSRPGPGGREQQGCGSSGNRWRGGERWRSPRCWRGRGRWHVSYRGCGMEPRGQGWSALDPLTPPLTQGHGAGALWVQRNPMARSDWIPPRWPVWLGLHFICFLCTQYLLCAKKEVWKQI